MPELPEGAYEATLTCLKGPEKGRTISLDREEVTVGRDPDRNTVVLADTSVSREHARIAWENDAWMIEDKGSSNGVFLNEIKIKKTALRHENVVRIGHVPFKFEGQEPPPAPAPAGGELEKTMTGAPPGQAAPDYERTMMFGGEEHTMFGGNKAVAAFVEALKEGKQQKEEQKETPAAAGAAGEEADLPRGEYSPTYGRKVLDAAQLRRRVLLIGLGGFLLFALFVTWVVVYTIGARALGRAERRSTGAVETFTQMEEVAVPTGSEADEVMRRQLGELREMRAGIARRLETYPGSEAIRTALARTDFLIFERELRLEILAEAPGAAAAVLADTQASPLAETEVGETLLPLAADYVTIKRFILSHPALPRTATTAPPRDEVTRAGAAVTELTRLRKERQTAMIWCSLFDDMVSRAVEEDAAIVRQWQRFWEEIEAVRTAGPGERPRLVEALKRAYPRLRIVQQMR
jgi:hypothetical protein